MNDVLTTDNFPMVLLKDKVLTEKEYEVVPEAEVIAGKTIIINRAGMLWLYMGDDHRRDEPKQIIAKEIGNPNMGFLDIESKVAIRLTNYKYA